MNVANLSQSGTYATVKLSAHIDWISYTASAMSARNVENGLVLMQDFFQPYRVVRATNGYSNARQYKSGAIVQWHPNHPSMGIHCTYSAQALSFASENFGMSQDAILDELENWKVNNRGEDVYPKDLVEVRFVNGTTDTGPAAKFDWESFGKVNSIYKYRVLEVSTQ